MSVDPETTGGPVVALARTRTELEDALAGDRSLRAVVMTMGALHQGHLDLVVEAARLAGPQGTVVVTIFVNPLQFAAGEDLEAYPRTLAADVEALAGALAGGGPPVGRLLVFAPTPEVIYPDGEPAVRIDPGPMASVLEGAVRPTHFAGVCQVVLTLLHLTAPRWALFGRKDAQQLAIVRAMVRDLAVPVEIVPVDIRREDDGLAMSSRNAYLSPVEREQALALWRALAAGAHAARQGADPAAARRAALEVLTAAPGVEVDYAAVVDPDTFVDLAGAGLGLPPAPRMTQPRRLDEAAAGQAPDTEGTTAAAPSARGPAPDPTTAGEVPAGPVQALLAVAARVGTTRLIDNILLEPPQ
ncbi:MAG: pantoate--beta-alanine ligase [Actinomyces sp.]|uniref:pantoate--beta-alanine ligase n=1 Tax=Actinomyces sp. TaxID=29317 RepID=UPI0026DC0538|nr:pantoate--beta-alanine ligase [Actinomyces sp.]MDO4244272.1 pantoate--beta-alanine ligase [Actinomyces sp.]